MPHQYFLFIKYTLFSCGMFWVLCLFQVYAQMRTVPAGDSKALIQTLSKVKNGDTVLLSGGQYEGNFIINQSIVLSSKDNTNFALLSSLDGSTLRIQAPNVTVKNIKFTNKGFNLSDKDSCIYVGVKGDKTHIEHNIFLNCLFAIWLNGTQDGHVDHNTITGRTDKIISNRGNDIHLWRTKNTLIEENVITKGRDGIYISNSDQVLVRKNNMENVRFGVHFMYNTTCFFHHNVVKKSLVGLALMYSDHLNIAKNKIYSNSQHGYLLRQVNDSEIVDNTAEKNKDGIFLGGSYSNVIHNNTFSYNDYGAVITSGSAKNKVFNNNFIHNNIQVKYLNNSPLYWGWNGRGNYWSNYKMFKTVNGVGVLPYQVSGITDWLLGSYPVLNLIFNSPVMTMLQSIGNEFPVFQRVALIDRYPLAQPYYLSNGNTLS